MHDVIFFLVGPSPDSWLPPPPKVSQVLVTKEITRIKLAHDFVHMRRLLEKMHQVNYSEKSKIFFENSL